MNWKVDVDGRNIESEDELLEWVRTTSKGDAYYTRTDFKRPGSYLQGKWGHQKKWPDTYWWYTFWFTRKADAALFKLFWGDQ